jgi:hypothetical protein
MRAAGAGYAVVLIFGLASGIALIAHADRVTAIAVGTLLAAPILIALIGDRITGVKAFSVELTLAEVSVPVESDFSGAVMAVAGMGASGTPELLTTLRSVITGASKLLRLNLRNDDYWWSTRVFLVAALADDYTDVAAIVFVRSGDQRVFVGIATPRSVRQRMAVAFPNYEANYRKVKSEVTYLPTSSGDQELSEILNWRWGASFTPTTEDTAKIVTRTQDLRVWLDRDLDTDDLPYGPLTDLLRYRIVARPQRFTALTQESRLVAIVDRDVLAQRSSLVELEHRLS